MASSTLCFFSGITLPLLCKTRSTVPTSELLNQSSLSQEVGNYIDSVFDFLRSCLNESYSELLYNQIVSQGELLSTFIFSRFLTQEGLNARLLPALDFMRIDRNKDPDNFYIAQNLNRAIDEMLPADIYITQGFICLDADGKISNLERGGSDYTATIIGAVINADEVQIWTDIDGPGFFNGTPEVNLASNATFYVNCAIRANTWIP